MLRADLSAAGLPYKDVHGDCFDFHSLRGECASLLIESGADIKQTQEVLRHSTAALTWVSIPDSRPTRGRRRRLRTCLTYLCQIHIVEPLAAADAVNPLESLREVCYQGGQHRTAGGQHRTANADGDPKTPFLVQDQGSVGIVVPGSRVRIPSLTLLFFPPCRLPTVE